MGRGFLRGAVLLFGVMTLPWLLAGLTLELAMHWFPGEWRVTVWRSGAIASGVACGVAGVYVTWSTAWHWSAKIALSLMLAVLTAALMLRVLLEHESCGEIPEFIELRVARKPRSLVCS